MSITFVLALIALLLALGSATGKVPLWVSVVILSLALLLPGLNTMR